MGRACAEVGDKISAALEVGVGVTGGASVIVDEGRGVCVGTAVKVTEGIGVDVDGKI